MQDIWDVGPNYTLEKFIGQGSYGSVYLGRHIESGKKVAIKKIINVFDNYQECKQILRSIKILRKLKHPSIVKIIEIIEPEDLQKFNEVYIVMEYCDSDLCKVIFFNKSFPISYVKKIMYNILSALYFLHSAGIVHRDIKPSNILINQDCTIKICDFDLARSLVGVLNTNSSLSIPLDDEKFNISDKNQVLKPLKLNFNYDNKLISNEDTIENTEKISEEYLNSFINIKNQTFASLKKEEIQKRLEKTKNERALHKRQLSSHVCTRWYRPLEIIMLENSYDFKVDVWSSGCIFAELLKMIKQPNKDITPYSKVPIFRGDGCYPLSPVDANLMPSSKSQEPHDQISVILSILGTPNENDKSFISNPDMLKYLEKFQKLQKQKLSISEDEQANNLLNLMLELNPFNRISVEDCLKHPFFEDTVEKIDPIISEEKVILEFENLSQSDINHLKRLVIDEILYYKRH